jgi:hypothetical protein
MNITSYAEAGAATGSPRLSWRAQGVLGVTGNADLSVSRQVQAGASSVEGDRQEGGPHYEGSGVNPPSGGSLLPDRPRARVGPPPTDEPEAEAPLPDDDAEGWQKVRARWRSLNELDRRSLVL